ncbi:MAG: ribosomal-processing cysteine protease Prp [bacterium]
MIKVYFDRDAQGRIVAFETKGHALYAEPGRDIVCAAVSALLQNVVVGLKQYLGLEIDHQKNKGWMRVSIRGFKGKEKEAAALLETMALSLRAIAGEERYQGYVKVYGSDERGEFI